MGDVLGIRMFASDSGDAYIGCLAGFGERIVTRVKVFSFLIGSVSGVSMRYR
jgi:hypothetical protein